MLFTTLTFALFFIVVYLIYWNIPGRARLFLLFFASIFFYATWSYRFAIHFFLIILLNYLFVLKLRRNPSLTLISTTVVLNFSNIFLFKYFYFFLSIIHTMTGLDLFTPDNFNTQLEATLGYKAIVLPLAVSFYTFQITAYAIDVYRKEISSEHSFLEYSTFILFFPQLIAGPIMRHSHFFHQLARIGELRPRLEQMISGLFFIWQGIFKKVLIADNLAPQISLVFNSPGSYDGLSNLAALLGFGALLYCDFSGYTDLARGMSKLLGFELPENFYAPFFSASLSEFWSRWHRTLTTWLRDYIFIPLGGSRSFTIAQRNSFITLFSCSIWHGAGFNFFILGIYHGLLIIGENIIKRVWSKRKPSQKNSSELLADLTPKPSEPQVVKLRTRRDQTISILLRIFKVFTVFTLVNIGFVAFNTPDFAHALTMYNQIIFAANGNVWPGQEMSIGLLVLTFGFNLLQWYYYLPGRRRFRVAQRGAIVFGLFLLLLILLGRYSPQSQDFYYFQF